MTGHQPYPPPLPAHSASYAAPIPSGPPPWSSSAIAAFVLSLLGFLGVTAVLGLIFAVVGLVATRGGRRRGMGLAIAAIPISIVTAAIAGLFVIGAVMLVRGKDFVQKLEPVLTSTSGAVPQSAATLMELGSADFQQAVPVAKLEDWLRNVGQTHGNMTGFQPDPTTPFAKNQAGELVLSFQGKFVNGPATIRLTFSNQDMWSPRISDIEIGGSSPRDGPDSQP